MLSGLRAIKAATTDANITAQLNQDTGAGGANENARNWLKADTNEVAINTAITTVTPDQMALLREFETASRTDAITGKGLA